MSRALAVYHGKFGRASLYQLDRGMATHAHREGHLTFFVSGEPSAMQVDDTLCPLDGGYGCAVNPWQPHSFLPGCTNTGSLFLVLYINLEWFRAMARDTHSGLYFGQKKVELNPMLAGFVSRISKLLLSGVASDRFDGYLYELTQECYDCSWGNGELDEKKLHLTASPRDFRIRNSVRIMKDRLGEGECVLLNLIARESGLSRPHFFKLFRENLGLTPNIYLNTLRMETAIDRLTTTLDPVTSIGLDLGFSSQASFTRFFGSNVGIPPTDYRRMAFSAQPNS